MTDLRLAARRLLATPLFTIFAVLSLALGVAARVPLVRLAPIGAFGQPRLEHCQISANGVELTGRHTVLFERGNALTYVRGGTLRIREATFLEVVRMLVGA